MPDYVDADHVLDLVDGADSRVVVHNDRVATETENGLHGANQLRASIPVDDHDVHAHTLRL